jgi:hypothetical protein
MINHNKSALLVLLGVAKLVCARFGRRLILRGTVIAVDFYRIQLNCFQRGAYHGDDITIATNIIRYKVKVYHLTALCVPDCTMSI